MGINDLTYAINGAIFEVHRELGPEFLEKVYENALLKELKSQGLQVAAQVPLSVEYKGETVGEYWADVVVENQVIIELKTVEALTRVHEAQLLHYMKASGIQVGLLANFKTPKAQIKRLVLNLPEEEETYLSLKSSDE